MKYELKKDLRINNINGSVTEYPKAGFVYLIDTQTDDTTAERIYINLHVVSLLNETKTILIQATKVTRSASTITVNNKNVNKARGKVARLNFELMQVKAELEYIIAAIPGATGADLVTLQARKVQVEQDKTAKEAEIATATAAIPPPQTLTLAPYFFVKDKYFTAGSLNAAGIAWLESMNPDLSNTIGSAI